MPDETTEDKLKRSMAMAKVTAPRMGIRNVAAGISAESRKPAAVPPLRITDAMETDTAFNMAFLGTGQGGGRMAGAFWDIGYRRAAAFNTTDADFNGLPDAMLKHSLHTGGAGKDTAQAAQALNGREEEIRDLLLRSWGTDVDCGIICASLGGGTGSGTVTSLVQIARKYLSDQGRPPRVGVIVSLPPKSEGFQICRNACTAFQALVEAKVSPLIVIDNARIHQLYRPGMSKLHSTANETVAQLFHLFNQLAGAKSSLMTFDRSEFGQLLDGGLVVMGAADIQKFDSPADISTAIREQLAGTVLAQVDPRTGRKAACLFVGSEEVLDKLDLDFFDAGFTQLNRTLGSAYPEGTPTVVHRGLYPGGDPGLQCYIMIAGLGLPKERLLELAKEGGLVNSGGRSKVATFLGVQDGGEPG